MTEICSSTSIGQRLCNALDIDGSLVVSITIQASADKVLTVLVERAVTTDQANALLKVLETETKTYHLVEKQMPEPSINDLSHLSEKEFVALCPQGEHAPGAELLSPAAQAVYDATTTAAIRDNADWPVTIAAALRAAVDQVITETSEPSSQLEYDLGEWDALGDVRKEILAIVSELEAQP